MPNKWQLGVGMLREGADVGMGTEIYALRFQSSRPRRADSKYWMELSFHGEQFPKHLNPVDHWRFALEAVQEGGLAPAPFFFPFEELDFTLLFSCFLWLPHQLFTSPRCSAPERVEITLGVRCVFTPSPVPIIDSVSSQTHSGFSLFNLAEGRGPAPWWSNMGHGEASPLPQAT